MAGIMLALFHVCIVMLGAMCAKEVCSALG
jgi:hypothetical protein